LKFASISGEPSVGVRVSLNAVIAPPPWQADAEQPLPSAVSSIGWIFAWNTA
jgi:hypothetical protein